MSDIRLMYKWRRPAGAMLQLSKSAATSLLASIERRRVLATPALAWPPIFIVGVPRSGTTLIYQAICRALSVSYICNAAASFPKSPATVTAILNHICAVAPPARFESNFGETPGAFGPNQARQVWARWFPSDQSYVSARDLTKESVMEMHGTVALIEKAFGMPFLNKAQGHAVRIGALCQAFADAVFIHVRRDPFFVVQSVLLGREQYFGSREHWLSARPSTFDAIRSADALSEVCGQVVGIDSDIVRDSRRHARNRVFVVDYLDFCNTPRRTIDDFVIFYRRLTGQSVVQRASIPESFRASQHVRLPQQDVERAAMLLEQLAERNRVREAPAI